MSSDAVRAIASNTLFWTNKSQIKKHQKIKKKMSAVLKAGYWHHRSLM